jgi:hypothetical protein
MRREKFKSNGLVPSLFFKLYKIENPHLIYFVKDK